MSFDVKDKDLLARIGRLKTKSGVIETPFLFPVINPNIQIVSPRDLKERFGFEAIITNAYILKSHFGNRPIEEGLHKFLEFEDGAIMTDSGAYQILVYGGVEVSPEDIIRYQEQIGCDIATILDIPTGWRVTKNDATETVKETLKRAKDFSKMNTRGDILWVGPVQGGRHLDLVANSAVRMGKLPFQIHALGSPTEVMENYRFDVLVDMILTAKKNLPFERPLHLFGAGHPIMFSLAVALGCDLFDSAAYALYARENRYMTENGTWKLDEIDYFPCTCPRCASSTPKETMMMPTRKQEEFLAEHNLYVCQAELKRIKQAIRDGRLWEHMEMRAHAHPALLTAIKRLKSHKDFIEKHSPVAKKNGLFFFGSVDLARPEVVHYKNQMTENYQPPIEARILLLVPQTRQKPFHKTREFRRIWRVLENLKKENANRIHTCFYAAPFGLIPIELDEVYPLSQHEIALPLDKETISYVAEQISDYLDRRSYEEVILINDSEQWGEAIQEACERACLRKNKTFESLNLDIGSNKESCASLELILKKHLDDFD